MITKNATIKNKLGIHVRPSGLIIEQTQGYSGTITLNSKGVELNLNSIMDLLALGLQEGDDVGVSISGPEEDSFLETVIGLFEYDYDFPPK